MLIKDYLATGNKLFTDARNIFDADLLIGRITAIYSYRTIRDDLTPVQIEATGQNVIDCNKPLLQQLFDYANQFNPLHLNQTTITSSGDKTDTITDDTTRKNTGNRTTINDTTDTAKNTGTSITDGQSTDTPNNTVSTTKSAYNATAQRPSDITTTTGTNSATSTATTTNDLTTTTTMTGTITNEDDLTETNTRDYTLHNEYNDTTTTYGVSGVDEIRAAFDKYIQPYDYLATLITREVCDLIW